MSFAQKQLTYEIMLADGGGSMTERGLRSTFSMIGSGLPSQMQGDISIYGLTLDHMNQLITFGTQANLVNRNKIRAFSQDGDGPSTLIFEGTIVTGYVDGLDQPNVAFRIVANGAAWEAVMPSEVTNIKGPTDYATVMQQLAQKMGVQFENSLQGQIQIPGPVYLEHSYYEQALELTQRYSAQGANMVLERGVLAIWTTGTPRRSGAKASYKDGTLVGYPAFNQAGPIITMYFDPNLRMGDGLTVESTITAANGEWYVSWLEYNLASFIPHGPWFCTAHCTLKGQTGPTGDEG